MAESTYTSDEIRAEIKKLVGRVTEREPEEVPDNAHYLEELGVDSLMAIEVMIAMDRKFGIDIPDEEAEKIKTVGDAVTKIDTTPAK